MAHKFLNKCTCPVLRVTSRNCSLSFQYWSYQRYCIVFYTNRKRSVLLWVLELQFLFEMQDAKAVYLFTLQKRRLMIPDESHMIRVVAKLTTSFSNKTEDLKFLISIETLIIRIFITLVKHAVSKSSLDWVSADHVTGRVYLQSVVTVNGVLLKVP
jgi:hypothetical protein